MKLYAGSLYQNKLILYGSGTPIIITVDDRDLQWDIYCNDVEVKEILLDTLNLEFNETTYNFPYEVSADPMKTLGFSK